MTSRPRTVRFVGEVILLWAAVSLPLFLIYELIERLWLHGLPAGQREVGHMLRGMAISLATGIATAAYLLWRVVPALGSGLVPREDRPEARAAAREGLVDWLLGLRWVAVLALAAVVAYAIRVSDRIPPESHAELWAGVGVLAAFNLVLTLRGARHLASQRLLVLQIAGDVVILAWLVHHAGGIANPFSGFFVFHAVIAAIVLEPRRARIVALAVGCFVLALTLAETTVLVPACTRDPDGVCRGGRDALHVLAAGLAVGSIVVGCAFIVITLVRTLHAERNRLAAATRDLTKERETLQTILSCMADAVLYVGPSGDVRLQNRAAEALWAEHPQYRADLRVCHTPERWQEVLDIVANPNPFQLHPTLMVKGRAYEATYARVVTEGALGGVVMVARDVTERNAAHQWQMQEERMATVGKLAAALAHELNNPLGAIALFTQHALKRIEPEHPLAEHLGTVMRNADLCKKIVRDLLEYARQRPPERRDVAPADLLGDVLRTLQPHAEQSHVDMRRDLEGEPTAIYGDPDQLRQVLVNLGLNAIEAMEGGGRLTFRCRADGDKVRIDVADTGPGLAPEELEKIFAAFYTTKAEGTGLGLTVARDIVTAHAGALEVASTPGQGTTFSVILPAMKPAASAPSEATA